MSAAEVCWVGGIWLLDHDGQRQTIRDSAWLDTWLARQGTTRADLTFPSRALRERFVLEFGPLHGDPTSPAR